MKTAGQILHTTRLHNQLDIDTISRATRIRASFLLALESDDYGKLPSGTVAKGFIKNYSEYLGLNSNYVLAVFRRDFVQDASGQIVPRGMVEPVEKISFWTPRSTIISIVALIFTLFGVYLVYQYTILTGPPTLEITTPLENSVTNETTTEVEGITDPEATISVAGQLVALDKGGHFSFRVVLKEGPNRITVVAKSKSGKTTSQSRVVKLTTTPSIP